MSIHMKFLNYIKLSWKTPLQNLTAIELLYCNSVICFKIIKKKRGIVSYLIMFLVFNKQQQRENVQ